MRAGEGREDASEGNNISEGEGSYGLGALVDDLASLKHNDIVDIGESVETMGNHKGGTALHETLQGRHDL